MKDRTQESTESLLEDFLMYAKGLAKGGDPWVVYLKANALRGIWVELEARGVKPPWDKACLYAHSPLVQSLLRAGGYPCPC